MKNLLLSLVCSLFFLSTFTVSAQIYEKKTAQSITDFVKQIMPKGDAYSLDVHQPIEGFWGDESMGKKIVFFYKDSLNNYVTVLQPVSKKGAKYAIINKVAVGAGQFPEESAVISVFFEDVLGDGIKELFVLAEGNSYVISEDENTPPLVFHSKTYDTYILRQVQNELGFQLLVEEIYPIDSGLGLEKLNLNDLKNAAEIRAALKEFLAKKEAEEK